jgi:hypothetical protein
MRSTSGSSGANAPLLLAAILATSGLPPSAGAELVLGAEQLLDDPSEGAEYAAAADLDGDGDLDIAVAEALAFDVKVFLNDGAPEPSFTPVQATALPQSPTAVVAGDLDGDGDVDLASASRFDSGVAWYENVGGEPLAFVDHPLTLDVGLDGIYNLRLGDLDGDGDLDIALASRGASAVAWLENDGAVPPSFQEHVLSFQALQVSTVEIDDLDGDLDLDLLAAAPHADRVTWYENDGGSPPAFVERVVSDPEGGARMVATADLDGDGDVDVISAGERNNAVAWHESDGGSPPSFTRHVLSPDESFVIGLTVADLDCDGDPDIFTSDLVTGEICVFENEGGSPPAFTRKVLLAGLGQGAGAVAGADLDADGVPDLVAAWLGDSRATWYRNESEAPACSRHCQNGVEDDGDGLIDYPVDPECPTRAGGSEHPTRRRGCGLGLFLAFPLVLGILERRARI